MGMNSETVQYVQCVTVYSTYCGVTHQVKVWYQRELWSSQVPCLFLWLQTDSSCRLWSRRNRSPDTCYRTWFVLLQLQVIREHKSMWSNLEVYNRLTVMSWSYIELCKVRNKPLMIFIIIMLTNYSPNMALHLTQSSPAPTCWCLCWWFSYHQWFTGRSWQVKSLPCARWRCRSRS